MPINQRFLVAFSLLLTILVGGATGFVLVEGYTWAEGFYMAIITLTTVGFGVIRPLSEAGRTFTAIYTLASFLGIAFAIQTMAESMMEKVWSGRGETRKMKKKIASLRSHYILCGFGRMGRAAAEQFAKAGADFVVVENDPENCDDLRNKGYLFIEGDATREEILMDAGIKRASGLLALLDSDPHNLYIVLSARELNPTLHIVGRAEEESSEQKVFRAGADSVVAPFTTAGFHTAAGVLTATGRLTGLARPVAEGRAEWRWIDVEEGSDMLDRTLRAVSQEMGREIVGLRREGRDSILPDRAIRLQAGDAILVIEDGEEANGTGVARAARPKLLIIDDNPVILRLYSRLFQKAGYCPVTAADGREGLDLLEKEAPAAAVIDNMLPVLSGIEVCQRARKLECGRAVKLILFTADDHDETRERALEAGADAVVIKTSEAKQVLDTVTRLLGDDPGKDASPAPGTQVLSSGAR